MTFIILVQLLHYLSLQFGLNSKVTQREGKIKKNNNFAEPKATISEVVHLKTLQKAHLM